MDEIIHTCLILMFIGVIGQWAIKVWETKSCHQKTKEPLIEAEERKRKKRKTND